MTVHTFVQPASVSVINVSIIDDLHVLHFAGEFNVVLLMLSSKMRVVTMRIFCHDCKICKKKSLTFNVSC